MPDADPADALRTWAEAFETVLNDLAKAESRLRALQRVPAGGAPADRLRILNSAWYGLAGRDRPPFPPEDAFEQLQKDIAAGRLALPQAAGLPLLLKAVATEITELLEGGAHDPKHPVVRSADFNAVPFYVIHGPGSLMDLNIPALAGFPLDFLPGDHWLRTAQPDDGWYRFEGRPAVILGPPNVGPHLGRRAKPLYSLESVLYHTREARRWQLEDQAQREREKVEKERLERRRQEQDPAYQLAEMRKRVAELERKVAADAK